MKRKAAIHLVIVKEVGTSIVDYKGERFMFELEKRFEDSDYLVLSSQHVTREALELLQYEEKRVVVVHF